MTVQDALNEAADQVDRLWAGENSPDFDAGYNAAVQELRTIAEDLGGRSLDNTVDRSALLNNLMASMNPEWRKRWCSARACACTGCANFSGGLAQNGFTKEDHSNWLRGNNV